MGMLSRIVGDSLLLNLECGTADIMIIVGKRSSKGCKANQGRIQNYPATLNVVPLWS